MLVELIAVHITALSIRATRDVSEHDRKQGSARGWPNAEERVGSRDNSNRRKESAAGISDVNRAIEKHTSIQVNGTNSLSAGFRSAQRHADEYSTHVTPSL